MVVRRLTREDQLPLQKLWSVCYLSELNIDEAIKRAEGKPYRDVGYGCFTPEGELVSGMLGTPFTMNFDGQAVKMSGIGGVVTHPSYRYGGEVKRLIHTLLTDARKEGAMFSGLYPFKHSFYRKFGYELGRTANVYKLPLDALKQYAGDMDARMLLPEDDRASLLPVHRAFAARYNLAIERNAEMMARATSSNPYAKNDFAFAIYESGAPVAYVSYSKDRKDDKNVLRVRDFAFIDSVHFQKLLGFLYRLRAEYDALEIELPADIPAPALADAPYSVTASLNSNYMIRALNCEEALKAMRRPGDYRFVLEVTDDFLSENGGKWLVTPGEAVRTELLADAQMSVQAFSQLVVGYLSFDGALMRGDVRLAANREALSRAFIQKPLYTGVYF